MSKELSVSIWRNAHFHCSPLNLMGTELELKLIPTFIFRQVLNDKVGESVSDEIVRSYVLTFYFPVFDLCNLMVTQKARYDRVFLLLLFQEDNLPPKSLPGSKYACG